jgi:hypothetical protein
MLLTVDSALVRWHERPPTRPRYLSVRSNAYIVARMRKVACNEAVYGSAVWFRMRARDDGKRNNAS